MPRSQQEYLIHGAYLLPSAEDKIIPGGAVVWAGETILAVGPFDVLAATYPEAEKIDCSRHLLIPGLINAHDHGRGIGSLPMGVPDDRLEFWLPGIMTHRPLDCYLTALYDGLRLLASGVTTTVHQHNTRDESRLEQELLDTARGYRDAGIRACITIPFMEQNSLAYTGNETFVHSLPPTLQRAVEASGLAAPGMPWQDGLSLGKSLQERYKGDTDIWFGWGPVAPQWCSDELLIAVRENGGEDVIQIHLLETPLQREYGKRTYGESPVAHLHRIGFLASNVSCAHSVWLEGDDIDLLAENDAAVVHNASSNLRLRSGIAPVMRLRQAGVRVGLGLDGHGLTDRQNMLLELQLARALAFDPHPASAALSASDVFSMATKQGAAITRGPVPERGLLAENAAADIVAIDLKEVLGPYSDPRVDLLDLLVTRARPQDVDCVIARGNTVVREGQSTTLSLESVEEQLAESLSAAKDEKQLARETLGRALTAHLRDTYHDWL